MSQKLILVKYELEDDIPVDESSEYLKSSYAPPELIDWAVEKGLISEIKIRESSGEVADVPISIIDNCGNSHLESVLQFVEGELIRRIDDAHSHISGGVLIPKELDNYFSSLYLWLGVRNILKEKEEKYKNSCNIKLVIG